MTEKWHDETWAKADDFWYSGKITRRTVVGWGGGAIGAMMLVPAPWRAAFGAAKAYKIGSEQPLSGPGAIGGKTAVVGLQMAADRINASGGINGRPVELVLVDDESKPDVGRRVPFLVLVIFIAEFALFFHVALKSIVQASEHDGHRDACIVESIT